MARKIKALTNFTRLKDDELLVLVNTINRAMSNNSSYSTPEPSLANVRVIINEFSSKLSIAKKRGSPEDTALKNESRLRLLDTLKRLSYYVNITAEGKLSVVLSSGFPIHSISYGTFIPIAPTGLTLKDGRLSGQVRIDFDKQKGILIYEFCYRMVDLEQERDWEDHLMTTSSKGNIIGALIVGQVYEVKVRAINRKGIGDWSSVVNWMVR